MGKQRPIAKIQYMRNCGILKEFNWDKNQSIAGSKLQEFKEINIFYGRNYSGKTTLSRIIQSLERKSLPKHLEDATFEITFEGGSIVTDKTHGTHTHKVRVFNRDFIKSNLQFLIDDNKVVQPFAVLGAENNILEKQLRILEIKLYGDREHGSAGLESRLQIIEEDIRTLGEKKTNIQSHIQQVEGKIVSEINKEVPQLSPYTKNFTYVASNLADDIELFRLIPPVSRQTEFRHAVSVLNENVSSPIPLPHLPALRLPELILEAQGALQRSLHRPIIFDEADDQPESIDWVGTGVNLHHPHFDECYFCNSKIPTRRTKDLLQYFSSTAKSFDADLVNLIDRLEKERETLEAFQFPALEAFFSEYRRQWESNDKVLRDLRPQYIEQIINIQGDLRKKRRHPGAVFHKEYSHAEWSRFKNLNERTRSMISSNNRRFQKFESERQGALEEIRLHLVSLKLEENEYWKCKDELRKIGKELKELIGDHEFIDAEIQKTKEDIRLIHRKLQSEENAARIVNNLLSAQLDCPQLKLSAKSEVDIDGEPLPVRHFQVLREGDTAYNLSEGEATLVAFCYFIAKLRDVDTADSRPIVWIDDPISSLDNNHIFFIHSMIESEIVRKDRFSQLFISTHNLDFLKYLTRLYSETKKRRGYYLLEREGSQSTILPMPKYLQEHATEYNHLFKKIYETSLIETITDENQGNLQALPNIMRRFLEMHLYYKYPNEGLTLKTLENFIGKDDINAGIANRLINEFSHLKGAFERGSTVSEIPETRTVAKAIVRALQSDEEHFNALLESIGEDTNTNIPSPLGLIQR